MATVSIAMATYNGGRYVAEQLESLLRQTVPPDELVVTDDGSVDETPDILAAFAARAPFPVRIEKNAQRLGFRGNFMKAAKLCRCDIIAFCDQDDVWLPGKLETCLGAFEHDDVLLVYHEALVVTESLEVIGPLGKAPAHPLNPPLSIAPTHFAYGLTLLFRRLLLDFDACWPESLDFYDARRVEAHDQWFFFLASCLGTIAYVSQPLAYYRRHGTNATEMADARGIVYRYKNLMATDLSGIRSRALSAGRRASALERMLPGLHGAYRARAVAAAGAYRALERHYHWRQEIYAGGNVLTRMCRFLKLMHMGGYKPRECWGVGRQAMVRDLACGVMCNRRGRRSA